MDSNKLSHIYIYINIYYTRLHIFFGTDGAPRTYQILEFILNFTPTGISF